MHTHDAFIERCHDYMDGLLSDDEQLQLERDAALSPNHTATLRQFKRLAQQLETLPLQDVPAGLEERIKQAVRTDYAVPDTAPTALSNVVRMPERSPSRRVFWNTAAAGLFLVVLTGFGLQNPWTSISHLQGKSAQLQQDTLLSNDMEDLWLSVNESALTTSSEDALTLWDDTETQ